MTAEGVRPWTSVVDDATLGDVRVGACAVFSEDTDCASVAVGISLTGGAQGSVSMDGGGGGKLFSTSMTNGRDKKGVDTLAGGFMRYSSALERFSDGLRLDPSFFFPLLFLVTKHGASSPICEPTRSDSLL